MNPRARKAPPPPQARDSMTSQLLNGRTGPHQAARRPNSQRQAGPRSQRDERQTIIFSPNAGPIECMVLAAGGRDRHCPGIWPTCSSLSSRFSLSSRSTLAFSTGRSNSRSRFSFGFTSVSSTSSSAGCSACVFVSPPACQLNVSGRHRRCPPARPSFQLPKSIVCNRIRLPV